MSGLFSTPSPPPLPPPVRQPVPNDAASQAAQQQAQQQLLGMKGRESTDLTGSQSGQNQGSSYTGTVLGK